MNRSYSQGYVQGMYTKGTGVIYSQGYVQGMYTRGTGVIVRVMSRECILKEQEL